MKTDKWLLRKAGRRRSMRLYCFTHAGGNAVSFLPWQTSLDPAIEVCAIQMPGRGARLGESQYRSINELLDALAPIFRADIDLPFALFGHSLGGLVAFELARQCARLALPQPMHLFVAGCDAPQHRDRSRPVKQFSNEEFIAMLKEYNGTPHEILGNRELLALRLPILRADFALSEDYEYQQGSPLTIPITVMAGRQDSFKNPEQVSGWQKETLGVCKVVWFSGGHFFLHTEERELLDYLATELKNPDSI